MDVKYQFIEKDIGNLQTSDNRKKKKQIYYFFKTGKITIHCLCSCDFDLSPPHVTDI